MSSENSPKLTTKIGVITITRDCTNFNKYMYLCLKEFVISIKLKNKIKNKKNSQVIYTYCKKKLISSKPRKEDIQDFSQKHSLCSIAVSRALMRGGFCESKRPDVVATWDALPLRGVEHILFLLLVTTPTSILFLCVLANIPPL